MKKFLVSLVLVLTMLSGTTALAVVSPEVTPNNNPPSNTPVSPKTADINTFAFLGAGVICIAGVVFCAAKARNE